jgi:hypothetical protein
MFDKDTAATRFRFMCSLLVTAWATTGCAHEAPALRVRFADVGRGAMKGYDGSRPLVIEFQPGDRLPVNLQVSGEGFELDPQGPPLALLAKEHCFLRVGSDGFRVSRDGEHFDKPRTPGTFRVGLWSRPGEQARLDVIIVGPRH